MYPPTGAGQGWRVAENKRDWPTRYDAITVDPNTGAVTVQGVPAVPAPDTMNITADKGSSVAFWSSGFTS